MHSFNNLPFEINFSRKLHLFIYVSNLFAKANRSDAFFSYFIIIINLSIDFLYKSTAFSKL